MLHSPKARYDDPKLNFPCSEGTVYPPNNVASVVDRDSSYDIAIGHGLDGPGIESQWERDFPHQSRPSLGPTHPPIQWVPGLPRG